MYYIAIQENISKTFVIISIHSQFSSGLAKLQSELNTLTGLRGTVRFILPGQAYVETDRENWMYHLRAKARLLNAQYITTDNILTGNFTVGLNVNFLNPGVYDSNWSRIPTELLVLPNISLTIGQCVLRFIVVLSNSHPLIQRRRMEKAIEVFNSTPVRWSDIELNVNIIKAYIVISGCSGAKPTESQLPEAVQMYEYALKRGVPKENLIQEKYSRNTIENIANSMSGIEKYWPLIQNPRLIQIVSSDSHIKRVRDITETYTQAENIEYYSTI